MTTLSQALHTCDMLLIDGLHAFEFTHDATGLHIELMDGRALKRWSFSPAQLDQARADGQDWLIDTEQGEHRLVLMSAFRAPDEDQEDHDAPADDTADR
ncbi:hypothetical protein DCO48_16865 [Pseudomonas sp. SDI]|uniref:DUF5629 family protein n=1 Tax=Pseudomonas sp. SDI TaxID=2170734 RepID=UPI000DE5F152|nr:DUF5629 family protein [Pseudomonas sp. SDI]PWB31504.1 hypothetical protein DCO48_16865 [Pseudomonas sp. SDI]